MAEEIVEVEETLKEPASDVEIENSALKELLAENQKTLNALRSELADVKKTNAMLVNRLDIGSSKTSPEELLMNFDKYRKKGI